MIDKNDDTKEITVPATWSFGEADYDFETKTFIPQVKAKGFAKIRIRTRIGSNTIGEKK